jgi:hypothetical protein
MFLQTYIYVYTCIPVVEGITVGDVEVLYSFLHALRLYHHHHYHHHYHDNHHRHHIIIIIIICNDVNIIIYKYTPVAEDTVEVDVEVLYSYICIHIYIRECTCMYT